LKTIDFKPISWPAADQKRTVSGSVFFYLEM
jgi:hypothetical protein